MADFYAARDNTMPPLPWTSIAPPFSIKLIVYLNSSNGYPNRNQQLECDNYEKRPKAAVHNTMPSLRYGPSDRTFAARAKSGNGRTHGLRDTAAVALPCVC